MNASYNDIVVPRKQVDMIIWWTTHIANGEHVTYSFNPTHRYATPAGKQQGLYVNYREVFKIPGVRLARALNLTVTFQQWALVFRDSTPFHQLRSLALMLTDDPRASNLGIPHAPRLLRREIHYLAYYSCPRKQLTHLNVMCGLSTCSWRRLLEACTNLRSAIFRLPEFFPPSRSIVHSNLCQLVLQSPSFVSHELFQDVLFPSLQSLRLSINQLARDAWLPNAPISLGSLHRILRSVPSLRELHVYNCIDFLEICSIRLPLQTSLSMFVPRLEHLIIEEMEERIARLPENIAVLARSPWICANWKSFADSERSPHRLDVEIILPKKFTLEHVEREAGDFYHPNVPLTSTEPQDGHWERLSGSGSQPGALDNWEDVVNIRKFPIYLSAFGQFLACRKFKKVPIRKLRTNLMHSSQML